MLKKSLVLLSAVFCSTQLHAWGPLGHRTVGLIAADHLTADAKAAVAKLLGDSVSLADVANWADELKSTNTYKQTIWYHFEKIPDGVSYIDNLKAMPDWQQKKGGLITALLVADEVLRNPNASADDKTVALKFMVHFVGDLHQPLHSGRPDDKGGNSIQVHWMGHDSNLHRVWDSDMIYSGHSDVLNSVEDVKASSIAYAKYLVQSQSEQNIPTAMDIEGWLNESMTMRPPIYDPIYKTDQAKYQTLHLPEIDRRLFASGLRLAAMLNSIFAKEPTPAVEQDLKKSIEAVVGDIHQVISFKP